MAAVQFIALREKPRGFVRYLEDGQEATAGTDPGFPGALESFCRGHDAGLRTLIAERTCQMNAVHRAGSALLPALCAIERVASGGEYALIEVGSSAGLLLVFDRLRFEYSNGVAIGPDDSDVVLSIDVEGDRFPVCEPTPVVRERHGLDRAPVDLHDPASVAWVRASTGFGFGLFDEIADSLADEIDVREADALEALPASIAEMPAERRIIVFDSVSVCSWNDHDRRRLDATLSDISRDRPVLNHGRETPRGNDPVDPNATGGVLQCGGLRQSDDTVLAPGIGRVAEGRGLQIEGVVRRPNSSSVLATIAATSPLLDTSA